MKGLIMAGGFGSRLRPLTCDLPKPMVPVLGKPVMEYSIELLKDHGITEIAVTTYYLPGMIQDYFGDGSRWGVRLRYFQETDPLGTAGSVRNAAEFLDDTFVVVSGDALTDVNLTQALHYHQEKGGPVTIVLSRQEIPLEYGVVMLNPEGEITRFLEKPTWGEVFSDLANTGIYILDPDIFTYYDYGVKFDFSRDLFPLLMKNKVPIYGFSAEGYWSDIGDVEQYMQTQFDILTGKADVYVRGRQIEAGIWVGEGTDLPGGVHLTAPIYLGEEVTVKPGTHLEATIIGDYSVVESGSSLKRSILWSGVYVGQHAELRAAFLCDGVKVRENVRIFEGAVLGKDCTIGRNVTIQPSVKIWPMKHVEDYTNLNASLVWENQWRRRLFNTYGVHGLGNMEITPDFTARLATAYGSTFGRHTEITVSSDTYNISRMLQKSAVAGLLSAGVRVVDLGEIPSPIARYSIAAIEAHGGMHIRCCYENPEEVVIEFFNTGGINIDRNKEREIERKFFSEDFKRAQQEQIAGYYYAPQMIENYLHGLASLLNPGQIRRRCFQLVLDYEFDSLGRILPALLEPLSCEMETTYNYSRGTRPLSYAERVSTSNRIAMMIEDVHADFGAILDHNGENLTLITEDGQIVSQEEFQIIVTMLLLHQGLRKLVVPISAPGYIETLAHEYGAKVHRTRSDRPTVMQAYLDELYVAGQPFFYPFADGVAALGLLLHFLADQEMSLGEIVRSIPAFFTSSQDVEIPWEEKGSVMRQILQDTGGENLDLVEGVKIHHSNGGWTLIYPDNDSPAFHVYCEANNPEFAYETAEEYAHRLEGFRKGQGKGCL